MASCLALAVAVPVPRWTAIEGFTMHQAEGARRRARGLAIGLGALFAAVLLEVILLVRMAASTRARFAVDLDLTDAGAPVGAGRGWSVAVAVLVMLLGFALLAAFLVRLA